MYILDRIWIVNCMRSLRIYLIEFYQSVQHYIEMLSVIVKGFLCISLVLWFLWFFDFFGSLISVVLWFLWFFDFCEFAIFSGQFSIVKVLITEPFLKLLRLRMIKHQKLWKLMAGRGTLYKTKSNVNGRNRHWFNKDYIHTSYYTYSNSID